MASKKNNNQESNNSQDKAKRIEHLLAMAWDTESTARILAITNQILEIDPYNVEALILKADNTKSNKQKVELLHRALEVVGKCEIQTDAVMSLIIYQRLAFVLIDLGDNDAAYKAADNAITMTELAGIKEDDENYLRMKTIRYRILIDRQNWQKILSLAIPEEDRTPAWAYARLLAAWSLSPVHNRHKNCVGYFWDALLTGPDIPFYMLGFFPEPDDSEDNEQVLSNFEFAVLYYDIVSISEDFQAWFSRGVILFGLLTNRFDEKERDYMLDVLDSLGGYYDFEKMKKIPLESDDVAVIEAMAANKCLIN